MKLLNLLALTASMTLTANAGDWGKAPVDKTPIEECIDLGGEISVGYETDYIFNGVVFAGDSVWTDVNYTFDGLAVPVTVGAWYLNGINDSALGGSYDEINLYVSADLGTFAGFDVDLGYTHYTFPEFRGNFAPFGGYGEANLGISRSLGFIDLKYLLDYAFGGGTTAPSGWFHQLGAEKAFSLTDDISLVLGAGVAYSDGYWGGSGWNHYYATASLPISLNCRTTLTPYIGYIGGPDTWIVDGIFGGIEPQSDVLHGGVALSVSF
jgi:hypothetical protein